MTSISASKFKEQCLRLLDEVGVDGILITKHGKPVARLVAVSDSCADLIGSMKGELLIKGQVFSTGLKWDAESGHSRPAARARRRAVKRRATPAR
jgi:prevent-host-death family protein